MAEEIELKLELLPSDAEALAASALLCGDPGMIQQHSVYFDTPDQALSKAGLSLRIRRSGATCIQTVKAEGASAAGLYARSEWELPVEGEVPVLDYTTPIRTLLRDAVDAIVPIFEVQVERRTWIIDEDGATIELVLDRGEVVAGDRQSPICEAELELKRGEPAALFALARSIDALVAVRLGVQTKAERGYRLAGPAATVYKAKPVALAVNMTAAEAFQRIVQSCLQQFRLNEALLMAGRNAEALHQARVALRRLRSAIAIFKPLIRSDTSAALNTELRWLAAELSDARNLDVLLERAKPGPLHEVIAAAREAAYDRAADALHSPRSRALMLDLAEWTATGDCGWCALLPQTSAESVDPYLQGLGSALIQTRAERANLHFRQIVCWMPIVDCSLLANFRLTRGSSFDPLTMRKPTSSVRPYGVHSENTQSCDSFMLSGMLLRQCRCARSRHP